MWEIIKTSLPQLLAAGFKYTIPLAIISFFFGLIIALVTALIRLSRQRGAFMILKWIASFYVWLFRSTPLLVQFGQRSVQFQLGNGKQVQLSE